jgi:hypothetical protein
MRYGEVIQRAFSIVWRNRYLWFLGVLGGGLGGAAQLPSFNYTVTQNSTVIQPAAAPPGVQGAIDALGSAGLLYAIVVIAVVVVLLVVIVAPVISSIALGALVWASAMHDAGQPAGLGSAWRVGVSRFWKVLGLRVLSLLAGLAGLAAFGLPVIGFIVAVANHANGALVAVLALYSVIAVPALICGSIALTLVTVLATISVVTERSGVVGAIGRGISLFRRRFGRTLAVWGIALGLGLASAVVLGVALAVVGSILVISVIVMFAFSHVAGILMGVLFGLALFATLLVMGGVVGAYFTAYWTLAFRRLELGPPAPYPSPVPAT